MKSSKVSWLEMSHDYPKPSPWVLDPDFGWLQFSYLPNAYWQTVDDFFVKYISGYRRGLSPQMRDWILFGAVDNDIEKDVHLSFDTYRSNDAAGAPRASQPDASPTRLE